MADRRATSVDSCAHAEVCRLRLCCHSNRGSGTRAGGRLGATLDIRGSEIKWGMHARQRHVLLAVPPRRGGHEGAFSVYFAPTVVHRVGVSARPRRLARAVGQRAAAAGRSRLPAASAADVWIVAPAAVSAATSTAASIAASIAVSRTVRDGAPRQRSAPAPHAPHCRRAALIPHRRPSTTRESGLRAGFPATRRHSDDRRARPSRSNAWCGRASGAHVVSDVAAPGLALNGTCRQSIVCALLDSQPVLNSQAAIESLRGIEPVIPQRRRADARAPRTSRRGSLLPPPNPTHQPWFSAG